MTSEKTTPWYKEPMMLLVIGVPLAAVVWGFIMLSLALDTKDSLVSNSYYKDGMSYTQDLRFHEGARRLFLQMEEVELPAKLAMVALFRLLEHMEIDV